MPPLRLHSEVQLAGSLARFQLVLLDIEVELWRVSRLLWLRGITRAIYHLLETASIPSDPEPQLSRFGTHSRRFDGRHHALIMQQHRTRILIGRRSPFSLRADECGDALGHPEKRHHLIDQVSPQVIHHRSAELLGFPLATGLDDGAVAVEVGFEFGDAAEGFGSDQT